MLTPQQQKVITATVLEECTEQDVAEELRMSQPAVHKMKKRALKRLRKHFVLDRPTAKSLFQDAQHPCRKAGVDSQIKMTKHTYRYQFQKVI